jgi:hypothetical protein
MIVVAPTELVFDDDDPTLGILSDQIDAEVTCRSFLAGIGEFEANDPA